MSKRRYSMDLVLGTLGAIWYWLSSATVPFGDAKGNGVIRHCRQSPGCPRNCMWVASAH
jgi:hypothetical protein